LARYARRLDVKSSLTCFEYTEPNGDMALESVWKTHNSCLCHIRMLNTSLQEASDI